MYLGSELPNDILNIIKESYNDVNVTMEIKHVTGQSFIWILKYHDIMTKIELISPLTDRFERSGLVTMCSKKEFDYLTDFINTLIIYKRGKYLVEYESESFTINVSDDILISRDGLTSACLHKCYLNILIDCLNNYIKLLEQFPIM